MKINGQSANELKDRVSVLYQNMPSGLAVSFIASLALVLGFAAENPGAQRDKIVWLVFLVVCLAARFWTYFIWKIKKRHDASSSRLELLKFRVGAVITAFLWSFYCLYFHASFGIYEAASTMVVVAAMTGGAATILSGDKFISIVYTGVLLTPYSVVLLVEDNSSYRLLGGLGIAFFFIMCIGTIKSANFILASIKLKYEHENLLRNLEKEVSKRTEKIIHLSQTDGLTSLMNRKTFIEEGCKILNDSHGQRYAVFFIDLNDFKEINDNYGHSVGDCFLIMLAKRFRQWAAPGDLICRWGGDEFVIFSQITSESEAGEKALNITSLIEEKSCVEKYALELSASIGIAVYPAHASDIENLVICADIAMYNNKKNTRMKYFYFSKELSEKAKRNYRLGNEIKNAIANNQLSLLFQPIYNTNSEQFESAEVLLRWNLDGEMISPDVFIPIAEKNGEIINIGYWVLEHSIQSARNLERTGLNIKICVNVSALQFKEEFFAFKVVNLLVNYDFPPERLHMELTESIFSGSNMQIIESIKYLQSKGVKISIDDFGTGYSSLSVIQKLRIDTVKIDKSFVSEIKNNGIDIIKSVIVMSHGLDFDVVAEGVEDGAQADILTSQGVKYLQGYFFSKPVTESNLMIFMMKHRNHYYLTHSVLNGSNQ